MCRFLGLFAVFTFFAFSAGVARAQLESLEATLELTPRAPGGEIAKAGGPDDNLGGLIYRYPINVSPGTGGHTPKVDLVYNSLSMNSPYGWGWSLSTSSAVERSTRFGAPSYTASDRFEIDGALVVYDAAASTSSLRRFHFQRHTGARVEYKVNENRWIVTQPDGTQFRYGYRSASTPSSNSRLASLGWSSTATEETTFRWMLDEVVDPRGNAYRIEYEPDLYTIGGTQYAAFLYPKRIRYSFHETNGQEDPVGPKQALRLIEFVWDTSRGVEPDYPTSYRSGFKIQIRRRLLEVRTGIDLDANGAISASEQLRREVLSYAPKPTVQDPLQTPYSRLVDVQRYGANDTPFAWSTTFTYATPSLGYTNNYQAVPNPSAAWTGGAWAFDDVANFNATGQSSDLVDLDGDGLIDRIKEAGTLKVYYGQARADGAPGVQFGTETPVQMNCTGSGTAGCVNATFNLDGLSCGADQYCDRTTTLIDLDGDGRVDYFAGGGTTWHWRRNLGRVGFGTLANWPGVVSAGYPGRHESTGTVDGETALMSDADGDDLPDHVRLRGTGELELSLNTGASAFVEGLGSTLDPTGANKITKLNKSVSPDRIETAFVDLNGDGLPDSITRVTTGCGGHRIAFGLGYTWQHEAGTGHEDRTLQLCSGAIPSLGERKLFGNRRSGQAALIDMNGDGVVDVLKKVNTTTSSGAWELYFGLGDGSFSAQAIPFSVPTDFAGLPAPAYFSLNLQI